MANYAQTVNVLGAVKTTKTAAEIEATGLVLRLYRERFGVTPVAVSGTPQPLDVVAALSADGRELRLGVVNPTEGARSLRLRFAGTRVGPTSGRAWVLTGPSRWSHNRPGTPRAVDIRDEAVTLDAGLLRLPPLSAGVYALPLEP
jgi:alpha-N-arabinofuranosidase